MLNKETKQAIKSMQRFVECKQDMSVITANEMKIILQYIEQIEKSDASKEQSSINYYNETKALKQNLDEAWEEWNNLNEYCNQEIQKRNKRIEQLESDKQKLIEKLEERMKSVEKCYQDLINPYYDERLNMINVSFMSRKEKEEFTNKRNCLLVQKHCYAEILSIVKGEKDE